MVFKNLMKKFFSKIQQCKRKNERRMIRAHYI